MGDLALARRQPPQQGQGRVFLRAACRLHHRAFRWRQFGIVGTPRDITGGQLLKTASSPSGERLAEHRWLKVHDGGVCKGWLLGVDRRAG